MFLHGGLPIGMTASGAEILMRLANMAIGFILGLSLGYYIYG